METFRPGGLELTERAAEQIKLHKGQRVLDVGCGLGSSLAFLAERFGVEPNGVELSAQAVGRAGKSYIVQGDAAVLLFPDRCFDAVFMECALPLMTKPLEALGESVRVLKSGGQLVISAPSCRVEGTLTDRGRVNFDMLASELNRLGCAVTLMEDETRLLRQFVAVTILQYGSLEEYRRAAEETLGGTVLSCDMPVRDTGYMLLTAKLT